MADNLDDARALLPGKALHPLGVLGGSDRTVVRRVRVIDSAEPPTTVIVKTFADRESWAREAAALAVLPSDAPAPRLLAAGAAPPIVVMSDLGEGANLADALLGNDPVAAVSAVHAWIDAVAGLHRSTLAMREAFRAGLDARAASGSAPLTSATATLEKTISKLRQTCEQLGVAVPEALADAFRAEASRLDNDAASALSPGDPCPDNNVLTDDGLTLIDFEHAEWRHVAWDVAYLRVPWPSCWCSWRLPEDQVDQAISRYRQAMADRLPYVRTPDFDRDLAAATDLWAVVYSSWFLPLTLTGDPLAANGLKSPRRRALLMHRLDLTRRRSTVPEIATFAATLHATLADRWAEVPLSLAPAFNQKWNAPA